MSELISNNSDFILYTSQDGEVRVDVLVHNESVWLTQKAMQDLFDRSKSTISEHISKVFKEGELAEHQVVRKFRTTAKASQEFKKFRIIQDKKYLSDFDKEITKIKKGK